MQSFTKVGILNKQPKNLNEFPGFTGTDGNDLAVVVAQGWTLEMGDGDDKVISLVSTYADMGAGNDVARGGRKGGNTFLGGDDDDFLAVSGDYNYIDGGYGNDILLGGSGKDTIVFDSTDVIVHGGGGSDRFVLNPFTGVGVAEISDFNGNADSSQHDVLDLSMFGNLEAKDITLFQYDDNGGQLMYINGNEAYGRQDVVLVGVSFDGGIDQAIADGILMMGGGKG